MRRRLAIPLIVALAAIPWFWFKPPPPAADLPARLVSVHEFETQNDWFGGLSGLEMSSDGRQAHVISDRGVLVSADVIRDGDAITGFQIIRARSLWDHEQGPRKLPFSDAEGLAIDGDGTLYVSFEHIHRVLVYPEWGATGLWASYAPAWRTFPPNGGLEALAIAPDGTLYSLPEKKLIAGTAAPVYRLKPGQTWEQPFTLPLTERFAPVGADFGPDGRFYLLERGLYPFGFFSRVRVMDITETGVTNISTLLETRLGEFGNLEGLSVWQDERGDIRLSMVSDDNFKSFLPGQIVEYVLPTGVALSQQQE